MFLTDPGSTPYDLRWRMFGTDVRVHPMFWLCTVMLNWDLVNRSGGVMLLVLWIGCVFVSILLHEFGHVWVGQLFGTHGHIVLFSFGGLAIGSSNVRWRWQRILVLFGGPGIQLLLWAVLVVLLKNRLLILDLKTPLGQCLDFLLWINLIWPLFNLLPVWPLDGGQIAREVLSGTLGSSRGVIVSLYLSLGVAAGLALMGLLVALKRDELLVPLLSIPYFPYLLRIVSGPFTILFFALFAFGSYQALQAEQQRRRGWDDDDYPWRR
jgi:stage IV sporulation protein FB